MMMIQIIKVPGKRGFSLAELVVGIAIAGMVLYALYKFFFGTFKQFEAGIVEVENLEEARLAISYLRRDFSTACPFISAGQDTSSGDPEAEFAAKHWIRRLVFHQPVDFIGPAARPKLGENSENSAFIRFNKERKGQIGFYRFCFDPGSENPPRVEKVEYWLDPQKKCLVRLARGREKEFKDIEGVNFQFFAPEWAPEIPMLHVNLLARTRRQREDPEKFSPKVVQLSTTVNSFFCSSNLSDTQWNFESYQLLR